MTSSQGSHPSTLAYCGYVSCLLVLVAAAAKDGSGDSFRPPDPVRIEVTSTVSRASGTSQAPLWRPTTN